MDANPAGVETTIAETKDIFLKYGTPPFVARPVGQKEIRATPDAQRPLDVEWVKFESKAESL